jgi:hypothetical protein
MLLKIRDLKMVVTTLIHASDVFPPGQDRIQCYKMAITVGEKWKKQVTAVFKFQFEAVLIV